ncbi:hypothetical protein [Sphingomonas abaci]|uniref:Uncharacterized protein n=1 Tax=Sphingomonas abaci TaxID=237611 RepID=A0A7W7AIJ0_9SPHN|nr:hypothetical protein [Sphingomonas abaci]MBB4616860.1 hypothetical protein [Sphingomonas abaci]
MDDISISEPRGDFKSVVKRVVADRAPLAIARKKGGRGASRSRRMGVIGKRPICCNRLKTPSGC